MMTIKWWVKKFWKNWCREEFHLTRKSCFFSSVGWGQCNGLLHFLFSFTDSVCHPFSISGLVVLSLFHITVAVYASSIPAGFFFSLWIPWHVCSPQVRFSVCPLLSFLFQCQTLSVWPRVCLLFVLQVILIYFPFVWEIVFFRELIFEAEK